MLSVTKTGEFESEENDIGRCHRPMCIEEHWGCLIMHSSFHLLMVHILPSHCLMYISHCPTVHGGILSSIHPRDEVSAMNFFGKVTRRFLHKTKNSFGVYVINRKVNCD